MKVKIRMRIVEAGLYALAVCLVVGCASSSGSVSRLGQEGGFAYRIEDEGESQTVTITAFYSGNYRGKGTGVVIPANIKGIAVTSIGQWAFQGGGLTSVTIPEGVISIAHGAFTENRLTNVTIPAGVTTIGAWAFQKNQLTSVTIPASVTSLNGFNNNRLTSVTIPEGVRSIGEDAFANNRLTSVTIPAGVRSIGKQAFANNRLTSVTIPASVTTIGNSAFANNQLASVTIPAGVTTIGNGAFANNQLTSVTFQADPSRITFSIYDALFACIWQGAGTYERRGNQWYRNETALPPSPQLKCGEGIYIVKIDGRPADSSSSEIKVNGKVVIPAGHTQHNVYLTPGFHRIEVGYFLTTYTDQWTSRTWTEGTITFEYALVLESSIYDLTGTPQGEQILFQIKKR